MSERVDDDKLQLIAADYLRACADDIEAMASELMELRAAASYVEASGSGLVQIANRDGVYALHCDEHGNQDVSWLAECDFPFERYMAWGSLKGRAVRYLLRYDKECDDGASSEDT